MFGANQSQSSAFGARPGGIFGTSTPAANTTGGGLFGGQTQPAGTSIFGGTPAQQTTPSLFGGGTTFGTQAAGATGTSLFGATQQKTSLFGAGASTTNAAPAGTGLFGATQQTTSTAGAGGLFGATGGTGAFSGFGGQQATNGTTVKFNAITATDTMIRNNQSQNINTKHQCITAMKEYEQKSLEELRCEDYVANRKGPQTAQAGGAAFGTQPTAGGGLFGGVAATQANTGGGLFGQTQQQKPGLFGTSTLGTAATTQQQQQTSLFGQQQVSGATTGGGLFSKPVGTGTGLFGANSGAFGAGQQQPAGGLFGAASKPQTSVFGQTGTQQGTGLFGALPNTSTTFGTSTTTAGSIFGGQPAQQTGGLFGGAAAKPGGLFGATASTAPQSTFNFAPQTQTSTSGGLFGAASQPQQQQPGGLFGSKPATSGFGGFGTQPTQQTGLFQTSTTASGGLFGGAQQAKPATGIFGATGAGTNLFGATQPTQQLQTGATGLFGAAQPVQQTGLAGFGAGAGGNMFGGAQMAAAQQPQQLGTDANAALQAAILFQAQLQGAANCPYGDTPLAKLLGGKGGDSKGGSSGPRPTDPAEQRKALARAAGINSPPVIPSSRVAVSTATSRLFMSPLNKSGNFMNRSLGGASAGNKSSLDSSSLFDQPADETNAFRDGLQPKKNFRRLVLRNRGDRYRSLPGGGDNSRIISQVLAQQTSNEAPSPLVSSVTAKSGAAGGLFSRQPNNEVSILNDDSSMVVGGSGPHAAVSQLDETPASGKVLQPVQNSTPAQPIHKDSSKDTGTPAGLTNKMKAGTVPSGTKTIDLSGKETVLDVSSEVQRVECQNEAGVKLTKSDYYTIPPVQDLDDYTFAGTKRCVLSDGFTIGRRTYGSIFFPGKVDITGMNLDDLVVFRHKEVAVYPDENCKPEVGQGLNRRAEVTLERVWPLDKSSRTPIQDADRLEQLRFRDKLERVCSDMGAKFKDYRPDTGAWVFEVPHFSKYGLLDEESEEESHPVDKKAKMSSVPLRPNHDEMLQGEVQRARVPGPKKLAAGQQRTDSILSDVENDATLTNVGLGGTSFARMPEHNEHLGNTGDQNSLLTSHLLNLSSEGVATARALRSFVKTENELDNQDSVMGENGNSADEKWLMDASGVSKFERGVKLLQDLRPLQPLKSSQKTSEQKASATIMPKLEKNLTLFPPKYPHFLVPHSCAAAENVRKVSSGETSVRSMKAYGFRACFGNGVWREVTQPVLEDLDMPGGLAPHCRKPGVISLRRFHAARNVKLENLESLIDCQMKRTARVDPESSEMVPQISPIVDSELIHDYCKVAKVQDLPYFTKSTFDLCRALWAELGFKNPAISVYHENLRRRRAVADWARRHCENGLKEKVNSLSDTDRIFELLRHGDVKSATKAALGTHPRLGCIVAQLCAGPPAPELRAMMLEALQQWFDSGSDALMQRSLFATYMLCAGEVMSERDRAQPEIVNAAEGMDWIGAIGQKMWFSTPPTADLSVCLCTYNEGVEQSQAPPPDLLIGSEPNSASIDVRFRLIELYVDRVKPLERVLKSGSCTSDPMDYHLSWHLWCILRALEYCQIDKSVEDRLHVCYAIQLTECKLYKQAAFVLAHIGDDVQRLWRMEDLLQRVISAESSEIAGDLFDFLVDALQISHILVSDTSALHAQQCGKPGDQVDFLLSAQRWHKAHELFVQKVAPMFVVNEDWHNLRLVVEALSEHSDAIPHWTVGGQTFEIFLNMEQNLASLASVDDDNEESELLANIKSQVEVLLNRLTAMKCDSPLQELCRLELSTRCVHVCRRALTPADQLTLDSLIGKLPSHPGAVVADAMRSLNLD